MNNGHTTRDLRLCKNTFACYMRGCTYSRCIPLLDGIDENTITHLRDAILHRNLPLNLDVTYDTFKRTKGMSGILIHIMRYTRTTVTIITKKFPQYLCNRLRGPKMLRFDPKSNFIQVVFKDGIWIFTTGMLPWWESMDCFDILEISNFGHSSPNAFKYGKFSKIIVPTEPTKLQTTKIMELLTLITTIVNVELCNFAVTDNLLSFCDSISKLERVSDISIRNTIAVSNLHGFTKIMMTLGRNMNLDMCLSMVFSNPNLTSLIIRNTYADDVLSKECVEYIYNQLLCNGKMIEIQLPKLTYPMISLDVDRCQYVPDSDRIMGEDDLMFEVCEYDSYFNGYIECPKDVYGDQLVSAVLPNSRVNLDHLRYMEKLHCIDISRNAQFFNNTTLTDLTIEHCTTDDVEYLLGGENVLTSLKILNLIKYEISEEREQSFLPRFLSINKTLKVLDISYFTHHSGDILAVRLDGRVLASRSPILEHIAIGSGSTRGERQLDLILPFNIRRNSTLLSKLY